ncbi:oxidoreductase [Micromonospora endophytica]|uniref:Oxidoreductase n=2 Tax=Micromonospora endophytica TaxID=515350 RepID=A0A2W2DE13_9ACTN|nr:oxidoreductase [Micromonospora endophytica]RIW51505.1 oxidoreductase [Micromonospora endophytica]
MSVELVPEDAGAVIPDWGPGAHVDLTVGDGSTRQYSLCGVPGASTWRIAVLRESAGRGGSAWVHDQLRPGHTVRLRGPRNHFALEPAPGYLFLAGGIGITPLLPMLAEAVRRDVAGQLHYFGRSRRQMAFLDQLTPYGDRVRVHPETDGPQPALRTLLVGLAPETLIYACGPAGMLDALRAAAAEAGCLDRLRTELFAAPVAAQPQPGGAFTVRLEQRGLELPVPADRSVLDVLLDAGVEIVNDCQEGICGSCETRVLAGAIDHRDHILTPQERSAGDCMMVCVSRAVGDRLVLDL